jgi:hypothetical protein
MAAASVGSADRFMGSGVWVQKTVRGPWEQVGGDQRVSSPWPWISIFTESGTFMLDNGWGCRDFSDVGLDKLEKTYTWVLEEITASL